MHFCVINLFIIKKYIKTMAKSITLSEEKLRNFISYSVARLLKEYKGLEDLDNGEFYKKKYKEDEKEASKGTKIHFETKPNKKEGEKGKEEKDKSDEPETVSENKIRLSESEIKHIVAKAVRKRLSESFDSLGQSMYSARLDQEGDFAKKIYAVMGDIENEMTEIEGRMDDDFDDRNTGYYYEALKKAYESLDSLVHFSNMDY